ncbi:GSCOCG00007759001-RA-CDS [Cotesia congregata]|nr:GSCOCG00007759001-RA-CDS [Cotesia congregata]
METEDTISPTPQWRRYIFIELPVFFCMFASGMTGTVFTDLIIFQSCKEVTGRNNNSCDIYHVNSSSKEAQELNNIVQPYASNVIMCRSLIESILSAFLILFLGPWSDKFGRKPLMISACIVLICKYVILSVLSNFDENPWMFLIASVPYGLLGNSLLLTTFCYIADSTEPDKRAWSLACLQTCVTIGIVIGTFTGPWIFKQLGYTFVFAIAAVFCAFALVYIIFLISETVENEFNEKWGNPFNMPLIKELFSICFERRDGFNRGMLWCCLAVLTLFTMVVNGNSNISYLFANAKLGWDIEDFSIFSGLSIVLSTIGTFGGLKFMKNCLGMADIKVAIVGCISGFSATLLGSLTTEPWHMYVGIVLGLFTGIVLPTTRSLISKSSPIDGIANVLVDLIVFQTCRQVMKENMTSCDILHTNSSSEEARALQKIIQPYASNIIMCTSIMRSIFPAMLILFFGPWSDKYGRKPLILIGYFVPVCRFIILSVLSSFDVSPWLLLLAYVPTALLGSGLLLATICYISDTTEPDKRAWHLACLQTCVKIGLVIGTFTGPLIFQKLNYTKLFMIATLLCLLSLLYVIFMLPETVKNKSEEKWGNPFDLSLIKQLILTCTKKRDGLNRGLFFSCLLVLSLFRIQAHGNTDISYLFVNAKIGWNVVQYSMFSSISMITSIVGTFVGLKIMRDYLGMSDITEALIGCISGLSAVLCLAFVSKPWHMYLEVGLGMFSGVLLPTVRSLLSKSVPVDDTGKVFSLATLAERILPLLSSPLYSLTYSSFIFTYPSPVWLLSSGIFFLMAIINGTMKLTKSEKIIKQHETQPNLS